MGLIRLLIFVFLVYLGYRVVKGLLSPSERIEPSRQDGVIDDMVQDPECQTYLPRREAKRRTVGARTYYFCSEACAERFERNQATQ